MKHSLLKRAAILPFIVLLLLGGLLLYRILSTVRIDHYRQYAFPMTGTLRVQQGEEVALNLFLLDEAELSELASNENIRQVLLITEGGGEISCRWSVEDSQSYSGPFVERNLLLNFSPDMLPSRLTAVQVNYIDGITETFPCGNLEIRTVDFLEQGPLWGGHAMFFTDPNRDLNRPIMNMKDITSAEIGLYCYGDSLRIDSIDFGVDGLQVKAGEKEISEEYIEVPQHFLDRDEIFDRFGKLEVKEKLASSEPLGIELKRRPEVADSIWNVLLKAEVSRNFCEKDEVFVISPVYKGVDLTTQIPFTFYAPAQMFKPWVYQVSRGLELLEEYGV